MDELQNLLRQTDLFSGFPEDVLLKDILPYGQLQDYRKGQFLIEPQQHLDRFALVISGRVQIMHIFPEGNYSLMSALTAGELLGVDLICTRTRSSPYHAIAAAPTRVVYFPAALLTEPGSLQEPWRLEALRRLLLLISTENMKKEYRLAILSQKGLRERILTYLTMQSIRLRKTTFAISFSREELAAFLCVNRSALSHELSRMQQEGILTFHKNVFTLKERGVPSAPASHDNPGEKTAKPYIP